MLYDTGAVLRAQTRILEIGYAAFSTGGPKYARQAAAELSGGCSRARIEYLFAGEGLFIDTNRWSNPQQMKAK
jgi:hypothetical protein